jgi:PqqD family protein of HPr-rel-A system
MMSPAETDFPPLPHVTESGASAIGHPAIGHPAGINHPAPKRSAIRWHVPPGQRLIWEDFGDRVILFDSLVGRTHLLNATAAEALFALIEHPGLTPAELLAALGERLELEAELPLEAIDELLAYLESLNLACPLP